MRKIIKSLIIKAVPRRIQELIINTSLQGQNLEITNIYFSQEGEDVILDKIFCDKKVGLYVDIGAHHPIKFSNTYKYYLRGWRGINIDAMPGSMALFKDIRPRDINLEFGVSNKEETLPFYIFNEATLNTFDEAQVKFYTESLGKVLKDTVKVPTYPLHKILDKYLPPNQHIDFMSIDVEGLDLEVLKTNNWEKYKPEVVLVEEFGASVEEILSSEIYSFLVSKGYTFISKTFHTNIFHFKD